jgi:hypothetical protein
MAWFVDKDREMGGLLDGDWVWACSIALDIWMGIWVGLHGWR